MGSIFEINVIINDYKEVDHTYGGNYFCESPSRHPYDTDCFPTLHPDPNMEFVSYRTMEDAPDITVA